MSESINEDMINENLVELQKMQQNQNRLGKKCVSLGLTDSDLFLVADIKKNDCEKAVQYLVRNRLTVEDLEKIFTEKHFDPLTFFNS